MSNKLSIKLVSILALGLTLSGCAHLREMKQQRIAQEAKLAAEKKAKLDAEIQDLLVKIPKESAEFKQKNASFVNVLESKLKAKHLPTGVGAYCIDAYSQKDSDFYSVLSSGDIDDKGALYCVYVRQLRVIHSLNKNTALVAGNSLGSHNGGRFLLSGLNKIYPDYSVIDGAFAVTPSYAKVPDPTNFGVSLQGQKNINTTTYDSANYSATVSRESSSIYELILLDDKTLTTKAASNLFTNDLYDDLQQFKSLMYDSTDDFISYYEYKNKK